VRSRSATRVLSALLAYVSDDLVGHDPHLSAMHATALVRGDEAVLLGEALVRWVTDIQPRFARAGFRLVDVPRPTIDLGTRELVVPEPSIEHDPSVLAALDRDVVSGAELPRVPPGRYPLSAWFLLRTPEQMQALTPAVAAVGAMRLMTETDDAPELIARLADLFEDVRAGSLWYGGWDDLVDVVIAGLDD